MSKEEKRYYWLKFKDDFFSSKRMKKLRKLGADFMIIYLKMQLKSVKDGGKLSFIGIEDNIAQEIALDIDEDPDKVQLTLSYLQSCGLIEVTEDFVFMPYVATNTGSETASAQRVRDFRNRQKALQCNATETEVKRKCCVEKEIEKDKDIYMSNEFDELDEFFDYLYNGYGKKNAGKQKARQKLKAWITKGCVVDGKKVKLTKEQIKEGFNNYYLYASEKYGTDDRTYWKNIDTLMNQILDWIGDKE